jgi:hypothetical protein
MSDQANKTTLRTAYLAVRQEYTRISALLSPIATGQLPHPLRNHAQKIKRLFSVSQSKALKLLRTIEDHEKNGRFQEGWRDYIELKTEVMPALSSELLAVIGGVYLHESELDNLYAASSTASRRSFSDMAEELVEDLADRSGMGWESVLIVGDERLGHSEAEIIRLRFPACDIWNLPFTAHEYGYLVAHKDRAPKSFKDLRTKVQQSVDPSNHDFGSPPEDRERYLDEVVKLWDAYHAQPTSADAQQEVIKPREKELSTLILQQEAHLCRLFADAFATFFVGPAYVYALLYLRFVPDDTLYKPSPSMPPFILRFVFAMETLKWMDSAPLLVGSNRFPFKHEVSDTVSDTKVSLPALWFYNLKSLETAAEDQQIRAKYTQVFNTYKGWLDIIQEALTDFLNAVGATYENWQLATVLKDGSSLVDQLLSEPSAPQARKWAILNAAWVARHQQPDALDTIQINALELLEQEDILKKDRPPPAANPDTTANDIMIVQKALSIEPDLREIFTEMKRTGYRKEDEILRFLGSNDSAYKAYVRLYRVSSSSQS